MYSVVLVLPVFYQLHSPFEYLNANVKSKRCLHKCIPGYSFAFSLCKAVVFHQNRMWLLCPNVPKMLPLLLQKYIYKIKKKNFSHSFYSRNGFIQKWLTKSDLIYTIHCIHHLFLVEKNVLVRGPNIRLVLHIIQRMTTTHDWVIFDIQVQVINKMNLSDNKPIKETNHTNTVHAHIYPFKLFNSNIS